MTAAALAAWLLVKAVALPHSATPGETPEGYRERLGTITMSIATVVTPYADGRAWTSTELGLAMLLLWHGETLFDQRIHAGEPHPVWHEDHGLAKCGLQIHSSAIVPRAEWEKLTGTDEEATTRCVHAGTMIYVSMARICGVWIGQRATKDAVAKTYAAYGSGGHCLPDDRAWDRANRWNAMIASRPDRSPVKGFHRATPAEIPAAVKDQALAMLNFLDKGWPEENRAKVGQTYTVNDDERFKLFIEKHAGGKTGVSVFVKD
jgi:hypothetical protein